MSMHGPWGGYTISENGWCSMFGEKWLSPAVESASGSLCYSPFFQGFTTYTDITGLLLFPQSHRKAQ